MSGASNTQRFSGNLRDFRQPSTQRAHLHALTLYKRFVDESPELQYSHDLQAEDLQGDKGRKLANNFAMWLLTAKSSANQFYAVDSIPQFLSSWFSHHVEKYPILKNEKEQWFDDHHAALANLARAEAIKDGRPLKKKTKGIRRKMLRFLLKEIMKKNQAQSWEKRAAIVILRLSCGRGGEVSTMTWNSAYWDSEEEVFTVDWSEPKTGRENEMTYGPDFDSWILDGIHAIASYLVACPQQAQNQTGTPVSWMFPHLKNLSSGGAARFTTEAIKECVGKVSTVSATSILV